MPLAEKTVLEISQLPSKPRPTVHVSDSPLASGIILRYSSRRKGLFAKYALSREPIRSQKTAISSGECTITHNLFLQHTTSFFSCLKLLLLLKLFKPNPL